MRARCTVLLLLSACGPVDSTNRDADDLRFDAELVSYDGGSGAVGVGLYANRPWRRPVTLDSAEVVTATVDGVSKALVAEPDGRGFVYAAYFTDLEEGTEAQVSLDREEGIFGETHMELPAPFEVDPVSRDIVLGFDDLVLTWAPTSDDPMFVRVEARCISNVGFQILAGEDVGQLRIAARDLDPWDSENPSSCTGTVTVRRERLGTLDPSFRTGQATGIQSRTLELSLSPW